MSHEALILIDYQKGFMPADHWHPAAHGYGELPVNGAHEIYASVNNLVRQSEHHDIPFAMTQDYHPETTAHFSDSPDFNSSWPKHCVAHTPGSQIPDYLRIPHSSARFYKGTEPLTDSKKDTSYSGANARDRDGLSLPEWLSQNEIKSVWLAGLALDYCVMYTALDLSDAGYEVAIVEDATSGITPENTEAAYLRMATKGIKKVNSLEWPGHLADLAQED